MAAEVGILDPEAPLLVLLVQSVINHVTMTMQARVRTIGVRTV
jgi:hypothetical protein